MMLQTCTRCRARRIKCDSLLPACANCARSDVECTFRDDALEEDIPRSYVKALNDRIQELKSQLALLPQGSSPEAGLQQGNGYGNASSNTSSAPSYILLPGPRQDAYLNISFPSRMTEVVFEVLSQSSGGGQPDILNGTGTGTNNGSSHIGLSTAAAATASDDRLATAPTDQLFANVDNKAVVSPSAVRFLLARYNRCIRPQFDILPPHLFGHDGLSLKKMRNGTQKFQILMACAIAAARESYRSPSCKVLAQVCRDWAGELTTPIILAADGDSLTAILLLLIYELADPARGLMWELLDLAVRTCIQLGWHRTFQSLGCGGMGKHEGPNTGGMAEINEGKDGYLSPPEGLRLLAAMNRIQGDLQPIFHRPDLLSNFRLSVSPADIGDRYRKMYVDLARAIYGGGPPTGDADFVNFGKHHPDGEGGANGFARHGARDNMAACPFVGEVGDYLQQLRQDRLHGLDNDPVHMPLIGQTWLLLLPVCVRHKQCVHCFQEPDDHTTQGMPFLRHQVVQLATIQLDLVYRAATASDEFLPPILASTRAFVAGCAVVTSILKQWTPRAVHFQELIKCTEILSLYAAHWDGGLSYLRVWRAIMSQI